VDDLLPGGDDRFRLLAAEHGLVRSLYDR
jgi:hypothetical protein